jgi:hypothetical protein
MIISRVVDETEHVQEAQSVSRSLLEEAVVMTTLNKASVVWTT